MEMVSIVVPIYNVEPFLLDCLISLSNQSYKNIEVLLIDDGSTDNSSAIAISFSINDKRFKYFKKENGGLSSARNFGIDRVNGSWIMFVDSDDCVSPYFVEKMINLVKHTKTKLGVCLYRRFKDGQDIPNNFSFATKSGEFNICSTCDLYLDIDSPLMMLAWNKIYSRDLFSNIRYPEGKIHEDLGTTYKIFDIVKSYAFLKEELYFYRINQNSISLSKISIRKIDVIDFYFEQLSYYKNKFHNFKQYTNFYKASSLRAFKIFGTLLSYSKDKYEDYRGFKKAVQLKYQQKYGILFRARIGFARRIVLVLSCKKVFLLMLLSRIKFKIKK